MLNAIMKFLLAYKQSKTSLYNLAMESKFITVMYIIIRMLLLKTKLLSLEESPETYSVACDV